MAGRVERGEPSKIVKVKVTELDKLRARSARRARQGGQPRRSSSVFAAGGWQVYLLAMFRLILGHTDSSGCRVLLLAWPWASGMGWGSGFLEAFSARCAAVCQ